MSVPLGFSEDIKDGDDINVDADITIRAGIVDSLEIIAAAEFLSVLFCLYFEPQLSMLLQFSS